ncbi:crosslink repair DNA glycosylase YcaQ family protein [Agrococcus sp. Marseille-Q4369]|uniref:DNA glycosylase AlkZ-like family protein n=1 Tax=Agrococcus sp. Marseille-Q4369 TaxID=2810513 RepID=UPI001B8BB2E7|nr:crosslink repair DNA glycosylase YcaQ family protein [Agrococcus sp. Marseille-Q4369]QUW19288.1 winged helix DNA-binding domain-containing protein [Agrococcus sp. Marseille-Q4369]
MATIRTVSREEARRIAVRAQLLDADRAPVDGSDHLADIVAQLTLLPLGPTDIVCPSAEHIAFSRVPALDPSDVRRAVEVEQSLFEHLGPRRHPMEAWAIGLRAMRDLPWLLALGRAPEAIGESSRAWLEANGGFRERVLEQLRVDGPLPQGEIADTADVPYRSSGWNTGRDVAMMLELLQVRGEVVVVERLGQLRVWDLAERVLPPVQTPDPAAALETWQRRWLRSLGIARPTHIGDAGEPVRIDGVRGEWRLDDGASAAGFTGRLALLSPLDRLIADRRRMRDLWGFEYALEQYTPAAKRRWGVHALPILDGDALVGKVDARTDRDAGVLRVARIHWDVEPDARLRSAVLDELERFAAWLGGRLALADGAAEPR